MAGEEEVRANARALLARLRQEAELEDAPAANDLLLALRDIRDYRLLIELAEAIGRVAPVEATPRRLYAQALIETGRMTAALDVLEVLRGRLPPSHPEFAEATGLAGRSYKQMFFDSRFRGSKAARFAMSRAIEAYGAGYRANKSRNTWHGVNLLACAAHCRRNGIDYLLEIDVKKLAVELLTTLHDFPESERDSWYLATLAEVSLGTGDWDTIESALQRYALSPQTTAFHLQSTLRQFTEVWNIQQEERGEAALGVLKVRMMELPDSQLNIPVDALFQKLPSVPQFQAVLGAIRGAQTRDWWIKGLEQGLGVAAVRKKLGGRIGTGFLLRSKDLLDGEQSECLVLTNFHVVNGEGAENGALPDDVEIRFEAVDKNISYEIDQILRESPRDDLDFSLLRLKGNLAGPKPLDIARALPVLEANPPQPQVYVIGHPQGNDLTYSFQDNELLDHEGPAAGKPPRPDICRVHYHTPTEEGNSGSPVFNSIWGVIALHHKGGKAGMPRLNGKAGTYAANEGIWIQSIIANLKSR